MVDHNSRTNHLRRTRPDRSAAVAFGLVAALLLGLSTPVVFAQDGRPPAPGEPVEPDQPIEAPDLDEERAAQGAVELFPHVRLDRTAGFVELDGIVPIVPDDPDAPDILLELVVTGFAGRRDHESLVMTRARASHVHAALLALGAEPGEPGRWTEEQDPETGAWTARSAGPSGPAIEVELRWADPETGEVRVASPRDWIRHAEGERTFPDAAWLFAGSQFVQREGEVRYDADFTGTIVGLAQFGSEVVAFSQPIHHEESYEEPQWFANNEAVPPFGTEVVVRLTPIESEDGEPTETERDEEQAADEPMDDDVSGEDDGDNGVAEPEDRPSGSDRERGER